MFWNILLNIFLCRTMETEDIQLLCDYCWWFCVVSTVRQLQISTSRLWNHKSLIQCQTINLSISSLWQERWLVKIPFMLYTTLTRPNKKKRKKDKYFYFFAKLLNTSKLKLSKTEQCRDLILLIYFVAFSNNSKKRERERERNTNSSSNVTNFNT